MSASLNANYARARHPRVKRRSRAYCCWRHLANRDTASLGEVGQTVRGVATPKPSYRENQTLAYGQNGRRLSDANLD